MDEFDKKILRVVQVQGDLSTAELGAQVGLSGMPVWRRFRRLKEIGLIARTVALLDKRKTGFSVTAFVMLRTRQHDKAWFARLAGFVERDIVDPRAADEIAQAVGQGEADPQARRRCTAHVVEREGSADRYSRFDATIRRNDEGS